jgi:NAD(P)-dependent dehydrogenase (short-subunit alcohol dehydrogenase family)
VVTRVAVVTGGGRGLGRAVALRLAADGTDVAVLARSAAEVEAVADEARARGVRALALKVDVTSTQEVKEARDDIDGHGHRAHLTRAPPASMHRCDTIMVWP